MATQTEGILSPTGRRMLVHTYHSMSAQAAIGTFAYMPPELISGTLEQEWPNAGSVAYEELDMLRTRPSSYGPGVVCGMQC